jgi:hypothetical protein
MFDGHLQVLFYAIPPNSQLLFSETGNAPLLRDFHEPVGPQGASNQKLHNTKSLCLMVTLKSCFMQYPQIPNFYLAKLQMHPFYGIFTSL